ncbi:hypothetical protein MIDIC_510045 [Alphaproteobacteria bacterium]
MLTDTVASEIAGMNIKSVPTRQKTRNVFSIAIVVKSAKIIRILVNLSQF